MKTLWGIDLGGTKIEGLVLNAETNEILARLRVPTEAENGYQHIMAQIAKLVDLLKHETGFSTTTIGFATPGTLTPSTQTMKNSNTICLNGMPMKKDIETILGISIKLANDANCFALAEATMGIVKDKVPNAKVVFGVIMGTGVGGGVVVDGKVINGKHGIGGEWGHIILEENGNPCYCGKNGCNEQVFSGPALQKYYTTLSGKSHTMKEIYALYKQDSDIHATATINHLLYSFGKAISSIINVLDPDAIVLGGGVGNIDELYTKGVEEVKKWIFNTGVVETIFLKPKLGDSAGVFGAAELVRNN